MDNTSLGTRWFGQIETQLQRPGVEKEGDLVFLAVKTVNGTVLGRTGRVFTTGL